MTLIRTRGRGDLGSGPAEVVMVNVCVTELYK